MPNADPESIRRVAKILNFAIQYEVNDWAAAYVVRRTCAEAKVVLTEDQASDMVTAKREAFPGVVRFYQTIRAQMRGRGYVETSMGRRLSMPWINGYGKQIARMNNENWKNCVNMPIQGTAAEIIKLAIIELFRQLPDWIKIIWSVHDSILFMVKLGKEKEAAEWIVDIMENVWTLAVPTPVDVKVGPNLADMEKVIA